MAAVQAQLDRGHTIWSLANASGVSHTALYRFMAGADSWGNDVMQQSTYDRIVAAPLETATAPAWPLGRRVRALRAAGHPVKELVEGMGLSQHTLTRLSFDQRETVRGEVDRKIRAYYAAHAADPVRPAPPKTAAYEWPKPLDWDDIDDPDEVPMVVRERELERARRERELVRFGPEHAAAVQVLVGVCGDQKAAAIKLGVSRSSMQRWATGRVSWLARRDSELLLGAARRVGQQEVAA